MPYTQDQIKGFISDAANKFGVNPTLLDQIARRESSYNPDAKNPNSSASGLFQFIKGTWDGTKAKYGAAFGVPDDASPFDPKHASVMAAALTKENALVIKQMTGKDATNGELYVAHFMGSKGAVNLITANEKQPDAPAAAMFPSEAAANPTIFYDKEGMPRSVAQVYANLTEMKGGDGQAPAQTQTAEADVEKTEAKATTEDNLPPAFQPVAAVGPAVQKTTQSGPQLESETERIAARVVGRGKGLMG